jgi:hypothetical protein
MNSGNKWLALDYKSWNDTLDTLHMKLQIIGKVKLALNPYLNQWWQVTFHLNLKGMTTGLIPYRDSIFEIEFNFIDHNLSIRTSKNSSAIINLYDSSVADFYHEFMEALTSLGIIVKINTMPCEFIDPVRFELDLGKNSYDKEFVQRWWKILLKMQPVFERFRTGFRGKSSPVHFFWGSFDLSGSQFSGKLCRYPQGGGQIMKFAENEENFTFGFWPGDRNYPQAAFYSYFYPAPAGIESLNYYSQSMKEFIFDYQEVINTPDPEETILNFLNETYVGGAGLAGWDVKSLRAEIPPQYKTFQQIKI